MKKEVSPQETPRAHAYEMWIDAPMPMVTLSRKLDVTRLVRMRKRRGLKFNMLMCWCIGRAASRIKAFYTLPVGKKLVQYDRIAVCVIVANKDGGLNSCDIPFSDDVRRFGEDYLRLTRHVHATCADHELPEHMVVGTSALLQSEIDGAVGIYSEKFCNPFLIWGRYRRPLFAKATLTVSFQFHHTQMDGADGATFLANLQKEIKGLRA